MAGSGATDPGTAAVVCAIHSNRSSDRAVAHQNGAPAPMQSNSNASASSGIVTKVVSGIATILATAPYTPAF
ncbi:hypothetical protein D9M73_129870 [compost metagenome]